jgi:sialic acid synthase SpsE
MNSAREIKIGNHSLKNNGRCFIVSEIGAMFEDIEGMKRLIRESKEAGADAVKLQTYRADTIALPGAEFEFEDGSRMSQYEYFKKYEVSRENHHILFDYAKNIGITIFSTPSYYDDVDFLAELGVPAFKTGADDLTNYPFLEYIAGKKKPVIISTGMATMSEVEDAVNTILHTGNEQLILLHSTTFTPSNRPLICR